MSLLSRLWQPTKKILSFLRRHLKATIAVAVLLLIGSGVYALSRPVPPTYVTAVAVRGDLVQTVEAVGTVVSEKDLELQFPVTDIVSSVKVKEGDRVTTGQILATLRSGSLAASVASAAANVKSAKAQLTALIEGSRPEDIAISEASVANKRASLEAAKGSLLSAEENLKVEGQKLELLKREAGTGLAGDVATAGTTISQQLATAKTALTAIKGQFETIEVQDALVKNPGSAYDTWRAQRDKAETMISMLQSSAVQASDYQKALVNLEIARTAIWDAANISNQAYDIMSGIPTNSYFTIDVREARKATIATQKSNIQAALSAMESEIQGLRNSSAGYDTKIAAEQATVTALQGTRDRAKTDIQTYQTALQIEEAQLNLKKAPARQTDIDGAQARVAQAQADLARAAAQLSDTVMRAPVDGVITKVNVKVGQIRPSAEPSITMLGTSPYRIEMFVSEVDIPKVKLSQTGSIELDAFRGTAFPLRVGEIDTAPTDRDGVSKYRVKLDFTEAHEDLKIGMTGDAEIVTGERKDVISIPQRAVLEDESGSKTVRVMVDGAIEERSVETGMDSASGNIEVTGIEEGETVIVLIKK